MTDVREPLDDYVSADGEPPAGKHTARNAALVVGAVLVLLVVLLATSKEPGTPANPLIGQAVPELSGRDLDGNPVNITTYLDQNKFVVVNFLASWCPPCWQEHPDLVKFSEEQKAKGDAVVIGVIFNDNAEGVRKMFEQGGDWPVIVPEGGRSAVEFGVTAVPESFIVAPNGRVVAHAEGVTYDYLNQVLAAARGGAPDAGDLRERTGGVERQSGPTTIAGGAHGSTTTTAAESRP